jgi:hypothetical protein
LLLLFQLPTSFSRSLFLSFALIYIHTNHDRRQNPRRFHPLPRIRSRYRSLRSTIYANSIVSVSHSSKINAFNIKNTSYELDESKADGYESTNPQVGSTV